MHTPFISKDEIRSAIRHFREICQSLNLKLGVGNSLDQRLMAAKEYVAAEDNFSLLQPGVAALYGEFVLLYECLNAFKDNVVTSQYHLKIHKKEYFDSVFAELIAAKVCLDSGFLISFREPDVIVQIDAQNQLSIACKKKFVLDG